MEKEIKPCIADGIASCMTFKIRNAKDWEEAKKALNEKYITWKDYLILQDRINQLVDNLTCIEANKDAYKKEVKELRCLLRSGDE